VTGSGALVARALIGVALLGCDARSTPTVDAGPNEPSPNASILPAPLVAPEPAGATPDAAPPSDAGTDADAGELEPLREDIGLPADDAELRAPSGLSLRARFRFADTAPAPKPPEANAEALDRARANAAFEVGVDLGSGRMRLHLASDRFLLAEGSEFRARADLHGHVLVFPDRDRYVTLQPGALRAVLNERRTDTQKLQRATVTPIGFGKALGFASEKAALTTPLGRLELEQVRITGALDEGLPLCRFLAELLGAHPETSACGVDLVPARADYTSTSGGRLTFEVTHLERVATVDAAALRVPPVGAEHRIGELPSPRSSLLLSPAQTRGLRTRPARVEPKDGVKEGLFVVSHEDLEEYVLIDGIPVARSSPAGGGLSLDLVPGSYTVSTRSFLGDERSAPVTTSVPSRFVFGVPNDSPSPATGAR